MIILASSSLARKEILQDFHIDFTQKQVDFDEDSLKEINPKSFAYKACIGKLEVAIKTLGLDIPILVADSVVCVNNQLQRKPKNLSEIKNILDTQNNNTIHIITAQILKSHHIELCDISQTSFVLKTFDPKDMQDYIDSNLWRDKAGGVMTEGFHSKYFVKQIGLSSTAMGLSIEKFLPFFEII